MNQREVSRRTLLQGSAALAGLVALGLPLEALEAATAPGEVVLPWLDQPPPFPGSPDEVATQLVWEELDARLTWNEKFFVIQHYGPWLTLDEPAWRLAVGGLVQQPLALSLAELRARPRQEVTFTLECSGNHGFPFFTGGIGTAHWAGAPLARCCAKPAPCPAARRWCSGAPTPVRGRSVSRLSLSSSRAACRWRMRWTPTFCCVTR